MKVTTLATVCDGETIRKGEPQPKASGAAEHMSSEGGNDGLGPTTLYGHAERGRSNRKVCLLFNRRRVHKGENYIWQGWEVPNAENSACPLRSRRKSTAHHYKISSDD